MFNQEEKNPLNQFTPRSSDDNRNEVVPQTMPSRAAEMEAKDVGAEKPPTDFYWWHAPWGEVKRVTRAQQRELMRQWLESGK